MAIRPVRIYGDPVLRQKAQAVTAFDDSLSELVADLFETMKAYNGVGLAAPQVGVPQRVFVIEVVEEDERRERFAIINPELTQRTGKDTAEEGCLSMPAIYEEIVRATSLKLTGFDEHGKPTTRQIDGYLARAVQHEFDHLEGILFTDRLSPLKRQFLKKQLDALARGEVPDGYHPGSRRAKEQL